MEIQTEISPTTDAQHLVMRFFEALGDSTALSEVFAPDVTWTVWGNSPLAGTHTGREAVVHGFHAEAGKLFSADHPGTLTVTQFIGDGPTVAAEFNYRTMTALGRQYHNHYVEVFEVEGDHIRKVREYMDSQHFGAVCY
ncbi:MULTISPECIES: nuclear transport factor 2 family protein [unclassified Streptomyces]|uniref:nuclear transport factor 2 family protein n=1 Tax=unclassified Streptomyces TaxID=2593676 RepID=UPI002E2DFAAF|nr:nuclear transport factor 2 family protein [Streptomyces sp. NBC_00223]